MRHLLQDVSTSDPERLDPFSWDPPANMTYVNLTLQPTHLERPDLWCANYLGDAELFDLVMEYNGIANFANCKAGDIIKLPDPQELTKYVQERRR